MHKPTTRYPSLEYVILTNNGEPESYEEAQVSTCKNEWEKIMQEEIDALYENDTYDLVKGQMVKHF